MKRRIGWLLFSFSLAVAWGDDKLREELLLKPLPDGKVYAHFEFSTVTHVDVRNPTDFVHFHLFPRAFGQLVELYGVQELHLSLTQGLWRTSAWGYPIRSSAPGAELSAWFLPDRDADASWKGLTNGLSGLLCASLNFITDATTAEPQLTLLQEGVVPGGNKSAHVRYAALPREAVCTENLTPWKKLLPCGDKAGLGTLLQAQRLNDGAYRSLGLHLRPICPGSSQSCLFPHLELVLSLTMVFDRLSYSGKPDWSLSKLFGQSVKSVCPLASTTTVYVDISDNSTWYNARLSPPSSTLTTSGFRGSERKLAVFNVVDYLKRKAGENFNVALHYSAFISVGLPKLPAFYTDRFATGYGEQDGGTTVRLFNTDPHHSLSLVYMEVVPWYFRIYVHTLHANINGAPIDVWQNLTYQAGRDRERPHVLEYRLTIPAASFVEMKISFDRRFLKWTEYPPDAHHGFYMSSGLVTVLLPDTHNFTAFPGASVPNRWLWQTDQGGQFLLAKLHTVPLLITLPTPDFSMPYNVICLTCTVVAIAFGGLHNFAIKRFTLVDRSTNWRSRLKLIFSKFLQ